MARSRSLTMSDTKDTVDHFITDRFIEIILDHKKTFNNALIIGDRNNFTQVHTGRYLNGKRHGVWRIREFGKVVKEHLYQKGELVDE